MSIQRALVSVSNKEGLVGFCEGLIKHGIELISTGGTAATLEDAGLDVHQVEDITGFPELFEGRVKTLHPRIHGGILHRRDVAEDVQDLAPHGIQPIDMVVANLYPFEDQVVSDTTMTEAMELVDIGGPAMLRAAAKNHRDVVPVCRPSRYEMVLDELTAFNDIQRETRSLLALEAFEHTGRYDGLIADWLRTKVGAPLFNEELALPLERTILPRYGENPQQRAAVYAGPPWGERGILGARLHQGKPLSYNNLLDCHVALELVREFTDPSVSIIKHATPSGVASASDAVTAWKRAYATDTVSPFGGIVAINREVDAALAEQLTEFFLECIIAPAYAPEALETFEAKPRLRVLEVDRAVGRRTVLEYRSVSGGLLVQETDTVEPRPEEWDLVTKAKPSPEQVADMVFGAKMVRHVRSNAIVLVKDLATVGIGGGQTSRVDAVRLAVEHAGERAEGSVLISDAFFPFRDGVDAAIRGGVKAIAQPGGSIRDDEVIAAVEEAGIPMAFTGQRAFRH